METYEIEVGRNLKRALLIALIDEEITTKPLCDRSTVNTIALKKCDISKHLHASNFFVFLQSLQRILQKYDNGIPN